MRNLVEQKDADGNVVQKFKHDPRVTNVGRILRASAWMRFPVIQYTGWNYESGWSAPLKCLFLVEKYQPWQRKICRPPRLTGWVAGEWTRDRPMHCTQKMIYTTFKTNSIWLDIQLLSERSGWS